jgi:anti-sigma B factor antagonist
MVDTLEIEARAGSRRSHRIVKLRGRLALDFVPAFLKALRDEVEPAVILDLAELSYIDSSGVGALVQMCSVMKKDNRELVLVRPQDRVLAVLEITKVIGLFRRFDSIAAAESVLP